MGKSDRDKEIDKYAARGVLSARAVGRTKCPDCGMQFEDEKRLGWHLNRSMCGSRRLRSKRAKRKKG